MPADGEVEIDLDIPDEVAQAAFDKADGAGPSEPRGEAAAPKSDSGGTPESEAGPKPSPAATADASPTDPNAASEQPETDSLLADLPEEYQGLSEAEALQRLEQEYEAEQNMLRQAAFIRDQNVQLQQQLQQTQTKQYVDQLLAQRDRQAQQQLAQQQAQREAQKAKWQAPEYDPAWLNQLTRDEKGNLVLVPGANPNLLQKIAEYRDWKAQQETKFWQDPQAFINERMQDTIDARVNQGIQAALAQHTEQQQLFDIEKRYASLLYANPQALESDPRSLQLTAHGQELYQRAKNYLAMGIQNRPAAVNKALQDMYQEALQQQAASGQSAQQPAAAQPAGPAQAQAARTANLRQAAANATAARRPNRATAPDRSTVKPMDFSLDALKRDMQAGFAQKGIATQQEVLSI